jgi:hypothetical protein
VIGALQIGRLSQCWLRSIQKLAWPHGVCILWTTHPQLHRLQAALQICDAKRFRAAFLITELQELPIPPLNCMPFVSAALTMRTNILKLQISCYWGFPCLASGSYVDNTNNNHQHKLPLAAFQKLVYINVDWLSSKKKVTSTPLKSIIKNSMKYMFYTRAWVESLSLQLSEDWCFDLTVFESKLKVFRASPSLWKSNWKWWSEILKA